MSKIETTAKTARDIAEEILDMEYRTLPAVTAIIEKALVAARQEEWANTDCPCCGESLQTHPPL